jgi:hypothetical protein
MIITLDEKLLDTVEREMGLVPRKPNPRSMRFDPEKGICTMFGGELSFRTLRRKKMIFAQRALWAQAIFVLVTADFLLWLPVFAVRFSTFGELHQYR